MCDPTSTVCQVGGAVGNAIGGVVAGAAASGFDAIAQSTQAAAGQLLIASLTWWVQTPSVDPDSSTVATLQRFTTPVVVVVLMVSILVQAGRMIVSRRKDPAVNVATGLLRFAAVGAVGIAVLKLSLQAGDALAQDIVGQTMLQFGQRLTGLMQIAGGLSMFLGFFLALGLLLLAAIQWVLGFVRQAGILVLAVILQMAASGSLNNATKPWLPKTSMWLVSLATYKPMAALIYAIGFGMLGTGQDLSTVMTGLMVLFLSVLALPVMMKFFSWAGADSSGGGVGGVLAGGAVAAAGAVKLASGLGGGGGAVDSAAQMDHSGPGSHRLALPIGSSDGVEPAGDGNGGLAPTGSTPPPGPGPNAGRTSGGTSGSGDIAGTAAAGVKGAYQAGKDVGEQIGGAQPEDEEKP